MKNLLFSSLFGVTFLASSLQGYYPEKTYYYSEETTYYYPERSYSRTYYPRVQESSSWGEILGAAAVVAGVAGLTYYAIKQEPFDALDSAKSLYNSLDRKIVRFFELYSEGTNDVAELAAFFYTRSAYPLVTLSKGLETALDDTKLALKKVRKALSLLDEEPFVRDCSRLQKKLHNRLDLINEVLVSIHTDPLWTSQYSLSLQEARMNNLERRVDGLRWQQDHRCVIRSW